MHIYCYYRASVGSIIMHLVYSWYLTVLAKKEGKETDVKAQHDRFTSHQTQGTMTRASPILQATQALNGYGREWSSVKGGCGYLPITNLGNMWWVVVMNGRDDKAVSREVQLWCWVGDTGLWPVCTAVLFL